MTEIKRQPPRFPVDMPALFRAADSLDSWQKGRLLNLSEGGVCLEAESDLLVPGDLIEVVIESKDKKGIDRRRVIRAKVVWRREGRAGLQFMRSRAMPYVRAPKNKPKNEAPQPATSERGKPRLVVHRKRDENEE